MKVDPKKLNAFANGGGAPAGGNAKGGGKKPEPAEEPDMPEEEAGGEEAPEGDEGEMDEGGDDKYAPIMEMLEDAAETITDAAEELDKSAVMSEEPLPDEQKSGFMTVLGFLDPTLVEGMKELFPGMTYDEAMDLGQHLADEGKTDDAEVVGGFLFHCQEVLPDFHELQQTVDDQNGDAGGDMNPAQKLNAK